MSRDVRKLPQNAVDAAGGKIFTYGSYRLGVYGPGRLASTMVVEDTQVDRVQVRISIPSLSYQNMSIVKISSNTSPRSLFRWLLQGLFRR